MASKLQPVPPAQRDAPRVGGMLRRFSSAQDEVGAGGSVVSRRLSREVSEPVCDAPALQPAAQPQSQSQPQPQSQPRPRRPSQLLRSNSSGMPQQQAGNVDGLEARLHNSVDLDSTAPGSPPVPALYSRQVLQRSGSLRDVYAPGGGSAAPPAPLLLQLSPRMLTMQSPLSLQSLPAALEGAKDRAEGGFWSDENSGGIVGNALPRRKDSSEWDGEEQSPPEQQQQQQQQQVLQQRESPTPGLRRLGAHRRAHSQIAMPASGGAASQSFKEWLAASSGAGSSSGGGGGRKALVLDTGLARESDLFPGLGIEASASTGSGSSGTRSLQQLQQPFLQPRSVGGRCSTRRRSSTDMAPPAAMDLDSFDMASPRLMRFLSASPLSHHPHLFEFSPKRAEQQVSQPSLQQQQRPAAPITSRSASSAGAQAGSMLLSPCERRSRALSSSSFSRRFRYEGLSGTEDPLSPQSASSAQLHGLVRCSSEIASCHFLGRAEDDLDEEDLPYDDAPTPELRMYGSPPLLAQGGGGGSGSGGFALPAAANSSSNSTKSAFNRRVGGFSIKCATSVQPEDEDDEADAGAGAGLGDNNHRLHKERQFGDGKSTTPTSGISSGGSSHVGGGASSPDARASAVRLPVERRRAYSSSSGVGLALAGGVIGSDRENKLSDSRDSASSVGGPGDEAARKPRMRGSQGGAAPGKPALPWPQLSLQPQAPLVLETQQSQSLSQQQQAFLQRVKSPRTGKNVVEAAAAGGAAATEVRRIKWSRGKKIGQGTYGEVFVALDCSTGEQFAVKRIHKGIGDASKAKQLMSEINVMRDLRHDNIVRFIGSQTDADGVIEIFLEYVTGGSLALLIKEHSPLDDSLVAKFTRHICCGVEYLHANGIVHRDIKGANVLLTDRGVAKLADFGTAKQLELLGTDHDTLKQIRGSIPWMAPEMVKQIGHYTPVDIWSVGCTILEMATGMVPWPDFKDPVTALFAIGQTQGPPPIPKRLDGTLLKEIMLDCFCIDPAQRATATQLLEHPFIQTLAAY
jgi:tRNA A-37 threonylcarbamoyl transferase component Bud32